jgi:phosphate transport system substrate-binding protein
MNTLTGANLNLKPRAESKGRGTANYAAAGRKIASQLVRLAAVVGFFASQPAITQSTTVLVGSGSTIPAPLYARWSEEYHGGNSAIRMRYLPVSTSEGIRQISHDAGDFAAGEARLGDQDRRRGLVQLPVALIAIVPIYNVPGLEKQLRLSGELLAGIYLGDVRNWSAPEIAKLNPEVSLPNLPIRVVIRPGGRGSNYIFTQFLSGTSSKFRNEIGISLSPKWPLGELAERSSDMAERVGNTPGAVGYVEYEYAVKHQVSQGAVLNSAGRFVTASRSALLAACAATESPRWNNFAASLTNAVSADSYPITSFTWIYLRDPLQASGRAIALKDFLRWVYKEGQTFAIYEGYTALPGKMLEELRRKVEGL